MCPYCGERFWRNSWGHGNARCVVCRREFIVTFQDGCLQPRKIKMPSLVIECHKTADASDTAPSIFHFANGGGFADVEELVDHHWGAHNKEVIDSGVILRGESARPYLFQKWTMKRERTQEDDRREALVFGDT